MTLVCFAIGVGRIVQLRLLYNYRQTISVDIDVFFFACARATSCHMNAFSSQFIVTPRYPQRTTISKKNIGNPVIFGNHSKQSPLQLFDYHRLVLFPTPLKITAVPSLVESSNFVRTFPGLRRSFQAAVVLKTWKMYNALPLMDPGFKNCVGITTGLTNRQMRRGTV